MGRDGVAVNLVAPEENRSLERIERIKRRKKR